MKLFYYYALVTLLFTSNIVLADETVNMKQVTQLIRDQVTCAAFYLANDKKDETKYLKSMKERAVRWSIALYKKSKSNAEKYIDERVSKDAVKYSSAFKDNNRKKDFEQPCLALNPPYEKKTLTIKSLTGVSAMIPFEQVETVYLLKLKIESQEKMNYPAHAQKLIFSGKVLDDSKSLGSYSIKDKDVIYLQGNY